MDLGREAGQVGGFLERGVAAADHRDLAILEEEPVARRAGRHAATAQARLAVEPEPQRRRPGRDDHGLRPVLGAAGPDAERPLGEVDPIDVDVDHPRPEPLGLGAHGGHQVGPLDAVLEARIVLDVAGEHQLAARGGAREDDRLEARAGRVDRGGQAGRTRPDDDDLGIDPTLGRPDRRRAAGLLGLLVEDRDAEAPEGLRWLRRRGRWRRAVGAVGHVSIVARERYSQGVYGGGSRRGLRRSAAGVRGVP